ncbi:PucR family transcriptional regulator ligand-binding domain-containing protein [Embleya sp. MST-111070]|uniref:PucR family transcriptional regulator ligand-binding domain-containing protein n=1 Tax=Embleya sp. MST-111070 TaxID=3398231 RepID=UPI003F73E685
MSTQAARIHAGRVQGVCQDRRREQRSGRRVGAGAGGPGDSAWSASRCAGLTRMGIPIRWLIGQRALGLRVLACREGLDRDVAWAHSIELADPTPWLDGGELLLTTGLRLPATDDACAAYVRRLTDAGVAALGFGSGLTHPQVPQAIVAAAETAGLPVLEVPLPTPFAAITKAVMQRLAELEYEDVVQASRTQPRMTRAALHGGAQAVVRELAVSTGSAVLLLDAAGVVRAAHPPGAAPPAPDLLAELPLGTRWRRPPARGRAGCWPCNASGWGPCPRQARAGRRAAADSRRPSAARSRGVAGRAGGGEAGAPARRAEPRERTVPAHAAGRSRHRTGRPHPPRRCRLPGRGRGACPSPVRWLAAAGVGGRRP